MTETTEIGLSSPPLPVRRSGTSSRASKAQDRLLDVNEAADVLGLSPKTLYQWAYERRVPVVKLFGRALRFRLSVIQKLIEDSERPALRRFDDSDQPCA